MSEKLNKEMEEVVEEDTLEEASAPTVKGDAKSVTTRKYAKTTRWSYSFSSYCKG